MLVKAVRMNCDAAMGRQVKRTRTTSSKTAASGITIRDNSEFKKGVHYHSFLVQGWKEEGKWQRKQFKTRGEAERFVALKRVEMENKGRAQQMVLSPLTETQHQEAQTAFELLGKDYSLTEAVSYFLRNHRPPDFEIRLSEALDLYLDDKERDGIRGRTLKAIRSVIGQFSNSLGDPLVHEVKANRIERFLRDLRSKDGMSNATRKTWNNYRNDLNAFFVWASTVDQGTNRPFIFENPVAGTRKFSARQVRENQSSKPQTTSPEKVRRLFSVLQRWRDGVLLRHFAYLYFAGIRPEELKRMAGREDELVNLKTGIITIPANVAKTKHERQITVLPNLDEWLRAAPPGIMPRNFDRLAKRVRGHFGLTHDEPRHSFISYHVAVYRSLGDAALQAGNSESIIRRHYLNLHHQDEGHQYFGTLPGSNY